MRDIGPPTTKSSLIIRFDFQQVMDFQNPFIMNCITKVSNIAPCLTDIGVNFYTPLRQSITVKEIQIKSNTCRL